MIPEVVASVLIVLALFAWCSIAVGRWPRAFAVTFLLSQGCAIGGACWHIAIRSWHEAAQSLACFLVGLLYAPAVLRPLRRKDP